MDNESIGRRIKNARENRKMTQAELGALMGVGQTAVSAWESGRNMLDAVSLMKLADRLDVPHSFFLEAYEMENLCRQESRELVLSDDEKELINSLREAPMLKRMSAYLAAFNALKEEGTKD